MIVVVNVEGVLAHGNDLRTIASYRGAVVMYEALFSSYELIALTMADEAVARWWLKRERMPKWARVLSADVHGNGYNGADYREWQINQVRSFLAAGWEIAFYLDHPQGPHEAIHKMGVNTLVLDRTQIVPGWRNLETAAPRAWDSLVDTVD